MNIRYLLFFLLFLLMALNGETKRMSRGRSSGSNRGSSRRTNYKPQPSPTSLSYPQSSAPKQSLSGWKEKPAQKPQTSSRQTKQSNSHSYPASQTGLSGKGSAKDLSSYPSTGGLSGNTNFKPQQRGNSPQNNQNQHRASNNDHGYPSSGGLSGSNNYKPGQTPQNANGVQGQSMPGNYPNQAGGTQMNNYGSNYHPPGPPPPYSNIPSGGYGSYGGYGGYGGHGGPGYHNPNFGPQMPGYFGNYAMPGRSYGGLSRAGGTLTGVGIAGAGLGTIMTGLALWNLARSTGRHHHTVIYDNRGQPVAVAPDNSTSPVEDSILKDLVNCTLTISNGNSTEILEIPCSIATSFTAEADDKASISDKKENDSTECTVTVLTKNGKEFMTTIPCATLLKTAAENNVTEPPLNENVTETVIPLNVNVGYNETTVQQKNEVNCTIQSVDLQDPINPCFTITQNLTVIPLTTEISTTLQVSTDHTE